MSNTINNHFQYKILRFISKSKYEIVTKVIINIHNTKKDAT